MICKNTGLECTAYTTVVDAEYVMQEPEFTARDASDICATGDGKVGECRFANEVVKIALMNGLMKRGVENA